MTPGDQAIGIGEAVAAAWYGREPPGAGAGVPLGVVAALALDACDAADPSEGITSILAASDDDLSRMHARIWRAFALHRPDLAWHTAPFASWAASRDPEVTAAVADVTRAAVRAGVTRLAVADGLSSRGRAGESTDVIGAVYQQLRADAGRTARGEFYTPPDVSRYLSSLVGTTVPEPGTVITDECAGTGGLLAAWADRVRDGGHDPADFGWAASDISPLCVAGLACNAYLWRLGPRVLLGVTDILARPEWLRRAAEGTAAAVAARDSEIRVQAAVRFLTGLDRQLTMPLDEAPGPG